MPLAPEPAPAHGPTRPEPAPARAAGGRRRLWLLLVPAVFAAYVAFGVWGVPRIVHDQVLSAIARTYHRQARLDAVRFNPLTLRLEARGFSLPDRDGAPMLAFRDLAVTPSWRSFWSGRVILDAVSFDGPDVRVVRRADGRINLQDLEPPSPPHPRPASKPLGITIGRLTIRRGTAAFTDRDRPDPITRALRPVDFTLTDFSTTADGGAYALRARTDRGERIAWRGSVGIAPLASRGSFRFDQVQAPALARLAPVALPFDISSGRLDLAGTYAFAMPGSTPQLVIDVTNVHLADAGVRPHGADRDWVSLKALDASGAHLDLARRHVSVAQVTLNAPAAEVWRNPDGGINLLALVPHPAAGASSVVGGAPAPEPGQTWTVDLGEARLQDGRASFEDRTLAEPARFGISGVNLAVRGLAYPLKAPIQVTAAASLDDGGSVSGAGSVGLSPVSADLSVAARGVDLTQAQPYLAKFARFKLASGALSADGHLHLSGTGEARYEGSAEVDGLRTLDPTVKQDLVDWTSVSAEGIEADSSPLSVKIRRVLARGAYARMVLEQNYMLNVRAVLETPAAASPAPGAPGAVPVAATPPGTGRVSLDVTRPAPPPAPALRATPTAPTPIEIGRVDVENGRLDFTDLTVQPRFFAGIQGLNGSIVGVSSRPDSRATVSLKGAVDKYAPVVISGQLNELAPRQFMDMRMSFQDMQLTSFSPYSGKFAGYRINEGKLNLDLHYLIDGPKLDAMHHVVIERLQLGDKVDSADAVKLPVKLIVALLKDRNGVIDLPIEVTGSLDDPKFRLWPVIWKVVGNLFGKIATAPFTLLGHLVGGGGEEMGTVVFAPGQADLAPGEAAKLGALSKALAERPALGLEAPMTVDPEVDGPALAASVFDRRLHEAAIAAAGRKGALAPAAVDAFLARPKTRRLALERLYQDVFGARASVPKPAASPPGQKADADVAADVWLEAQVRAKFPVTDRMLGVLARARAQSVQTALVETGHVDPARIFITAAPPLTGPEVKMQLQLR